MENSAAQAGGASPVLVVGSIALDSVRTPGGEVRDALGGSATYFSVAASLFAPVRLVGVVGDDFPAEHRRLLADKGIDLAGLQTVAGGRTFRWAGEYEPDMNVRRTTLLELNVFADFRPALPESFRDSRFVFLANGSHALQREVLRQVRRARFAVCDTMNHWIATERPQLEALLREVDAVILNDEEARLLSGRHNLLQAAREIRKLGVKTIVLKKGEHGALLFHGDDFFALPAYPLSEVRDPTGAGDSFAGGFLGHLARLGRPTPRRLKEALLYGAVAASFTVEDFSLRRLAAVAPAELEARAGRFRAMLAGKPFPLGR